jgi:hypothetical protein
MATESTTNIAECEAAVAAPGMFQGEARYVPHFWDVYLNGCADRDDGCGNRSLRAGIEECAQIRPLTRDENHDAQHTSSLPTGA